MAAGWGEVGNAGTVVVREGIEAVLIVASLLAGMSKASDAGRRRALWIGVAASGVATLLTWLAASALLQALRAVGPLLDAVVSLFSVVLLLLITNWFFHRVYWTGWMAGLHARKRRSMLSSGGQAAAMVALGFSSTYREGFETVVFLQTLALQTSAAAVNGGILVGGVVVTLCAWAILGMRLRLPYKKVLVATGCAISLVLVVMVGNAADAVQRMGWLPEHRLPIAAPGPLGLWLGVHGSIEGIAAELGAMVVVFGSYWLAESRHRPGAGGTPRLSSREGRREPAT